MATLTFREWITSRLPTFFKKNALEVPPGAPPVTPGIAPRFIGALALMADGLVQGVVEAVKARSLFIGPDDALPRAGRDSSLPRYPKETPAQHRARLVKRWDDWPFAGTEQGMLSQFLGLQALAELEENADWNWDGDAANWSRFWITIPQPNPWHPDVTWDGDSSLWDDPGLWDSSDMTIEDAQALRGIPRRFKPAHVKGVYIIVIFDNTAWNADLPDGTWGNPLNWNTAAMYISISDAS